VIANESRCAFADHFPTRWFDAQQNNFRHCCHRSIDRDARIGGRHAGQGAAARDPAGGDQLDWLLRQCRRRLWPHAGFVNRDGTSGAKGWLGTVGGGCDYQFSLGSGWGNWVVGAFADYDFIDLHGGFTDGTFDATAPEKESWVAAVGGRIGVLVTPQILTYVNGGWTSTRFDAVNFPPGVFSWPAHTFSGGFIGGGTEIAVAAVPGLYWRNEYRLSSYQPDNLPLFVNGVSINAFSHQSATVQTITTSLVWKFNAMPASVDLAGKAPPHAPMAVKVSPHATAPGATTWTGCYFNGGVGYGLSNRDHFAFNSTGFVNKDGTSGAKGWLGTVGGGCDYQFSLGSGWRNWVVGAFADYDFMDLHGGFTRWHLRLYRTRKRELGCGGRGPDRIFGRAPSPDLCERRLDVDAVRCR
jgi:hypothetical protein